MPAPVGAGGGSPFAEGRPRSPLPCVARRSEARAPDACCPLSADRAELAEKWKAEREAPPGERRRGGGEEEGGSGDYAVAEEEVGAARGWEAPRPGQAPGPVCSLDGR